MLALGLTTAVDYLLNLLDSSAGASSPFALADDTSWSLEGGRADAARDRLVRLRTRCPRRGCPAGDAPAWWYRVRVSATRGASTFPV